MRISDWSSDVCSSDLPWATDEQYDLLRRYLAARHPGGGMASMDEGDYADMVEQSPVTSFVIEYRERSEEHTSELQSLMRISYAVFYLKKKNITYTHINIKHNHTLQTCKLNYTTTYSNKTTKSY